MRLMLKVDNDKFQAIKRDLDRVTCSDVAIAIKYKLPIKIIQEIKLSDYNRNKSRLIRVTGFEKKSAYYENETDLLSCPFYNPKELKGEELKMFKYLEQ